MTDTAARPWVPFSDRYGYRTRGEAPDTAARPTVIVEADLDDLKAVLAHLRSAARGEGRTDRTEAPAVGAEVTTTAACGSCGHSLSDHYEDTRAWNVGCHLCDCRTPLDGGKSPTAIAATRCLACSRGSCPDCTAQQAPEHDLCTSGRHACEGQLPLEITGSGGGGDESV